MAPIAERLRQRGWQVDAAASGVLDNHQCRESFDRCFDVPFERKFLSTKNIMVASPAISRLVKENRYNLIHVHTPIASFVTRYAIRNRPKQQKLVYTAHGFHFHDGANRLSNMLFSNLEKFASPWMNHLVVINEEDFNSAQRLRIASTPNITHMSGIGVDLEAFYAFPNEGEVRDKVLDQLGIPNGSYVFLQVAEYTPNKRHCDTLRAFSRLPKSRRFDLLFAGSGQLMESSRELAAELNILDRVHFLGHRSDIPNLLAACNALLLVSKREGLPRSIMEALAMNKTVIGTEIRGTSDLLKNGVGILVPPCDPASLSNAMIESIGFKPDKVIQSAVLQACSLPAIIDQHHELYIKLLEPTWHSSN